MIFLILVLVSCKPTWNKWFSNIVSYVYGHNQHLLMLWKPTCSALLYHWHGTVLRDFINGLDKGALVLQFTVFYSFWQKKKKKKKYFFATFVACNKCYKFFFFCIVCLLHIVFYFFRFTILLKMVFKKHYHFFLS